MISATRATGRDGDFSEEIFKGDLSVEDGRVPIPIQENLLAFDFNPLHGSPHGSR
jgi:hypothetical protein